LPKRASSPPGERVHLDLAYGITLDLAIPFTPHHARALVLGTTVEGVTFAGKDLRMNLTDTSTATVTVEEDDALGVSVDAANEVPVDFALDRDDVVSLTPDPDDPLTAHVAVLGAGSVGQTAVLTVTATLPDGTQAQGTEAISVVAGGVKSLRVSVQEEAGA
jgi:propanediol dehydratase large subunit